MRKMILVVATAFLLASVLAGCGGADGGGGNEVAVSCRPIAEATSYRYSLSLKLDLPSATAATATPTAPGGRIDPDDLLGSFGEALTVLFSDMEMEGAFVAPDKSQVVLRFGGDEIEMRTLGEKSWVRAGGSWREQEVAEGEQTLDPRAVCEEMVSDLFPALRGVKPESDTVNGVKADRYHLTEAEARNAPEILQAGPESGVPEDLTANIWLAKNDRWPVRVEVSASGRPGDNEGGVDLFLEFRDVNSKEIRILPPEVATR